MKNKSIGELCPWIIFIILLFTKKLALDNWDLYLFWQCFIDDIILLILLLFMLINSNTWEWLSKRILYYLILLWFINMYTRLFGLEIDTYLKWYITPLIILTYSITVASIMEVIIGLYKIWKN